MSIISKETWDKFTEGEKREIKNAYIRFKDIEETACKKHTDQGILYIGDTSNGGTVMELCFGKENLQPEPKIWKDVGFNINERYCKLDLALGSILPTSKDDKLRLKIKATYKIAKLIELGYGGMVTSDEWDNEYIETWFIITDSEGNLVIDCACAAWYHFIAFHTYQQAEEFMSHPENAELVKQYYLL